MMEMRGVLELIDQLGVLIGEVSFGSGIARIAMAYRRGHERLRNSCSRIHGGVRTRSTSLSSFRFAKKE